MLGISDGQLLVILFILIVIVGPRRFPEIAREIAKFYRAFIKAYEQAKNDIKQNINIDSQYIDDIKKIKDLKDLTNFKNIKDIKNINPTEKIKSEWRNLIEEAKKETSNQINKEIKSDEEKSK